MRSRAFFEARHHIVNERHLSSGTQARHRAAAILSDGEILNLPRLDEASPGGDFEEGFLTLREMERAHIIRALEKSSWKVSGDREAAMLLGLKPTTLYSKIQRLGIKRHVTYSGQ